MFLSLYGQQNGLVFQYESGKNSVLRKKKTSSRTCGVFRYENISESEYKSMYFSLSSDVNGSKCRQQQIKAYAVSKMYRGDL